MINMVTAVVNDDSMIYTRSIKETLFHPIRFRLVKYVFTPTLPLTTSSISLRMSNIASQKRSNSALSSLSVGSIIRVPVGELVENEKRMK